MALSATKAAVEEGIVPGGWSYPAAPGQKAGRPEGYFEMILKRGGGKIIGVDIVICGQ